MCLFAVCRSGGKKGKNGRGQEDAKSISVIMSRASTSTWIWAMWAIERRFVRLNIFRFSHKSLLPSETHWPYASIWHHCRWKLGAQCSHRQNYRMTFPGNLYSPWLWPLINSRTHSHAGTAASTHRHTTAKRNNRKSTVERGDHYHVITSIKIVIREKDFLRPFQSILFSQPKIDIIKAFVAHWLVELFVFVCLF